MLLWLDLLTLGQCLHPIKDMMLLLSLSVFKGTPEVNKHGCPILVLISRHCMNVQAIESMQFAMKLIVWV